MLKAESLKLY